MNIVVSLILFLVVLPLVPFWTWGKFSGLEKNIEVAVCETMGSSFCQQLAAGKKVAGVYQAGKENPQNHSYFPVENSQPATPLPVKKENIPDLKIWAGSSVVIDAESGTILHFDNGKKKTQIASLTKIMTAILVMEKINNLNEEVTITKEAVHLPGTVVGCPRSGYCLSNRLYTGEKVRASDLLKAMLMNSANDSATALAIHIGGSIEKFSQMMNDKAQELGLRDTNFCTPSGLETDGQEEQCYSTAYDIARIGVYSLKYEKIWEIMRIPEERFFSADGKYMHELKNTDLLLTTLPNCLGGKTGFTPLAGKALLTGVTDTAGEHKIIAVLLNDENRWEDMKILINWVWENYQWK
ncbi:serine hydrolase [Patescibacteria group bacterium]|nr:serine hydrolase [Patescibacteria group bacterium]